MEEKDLVVLTETVERSKSNTHQIEEIKDKLEKMETRQETIYELTTSVKLIAQDMSSIKETINDVKQGQYALSDKVDEQISEVREKIERVDNKSKVDLLTYLQENWYKWAFGVGGISGIVYFVQQLVK